MKLVIYIVFFFIFFIPNHSDAQLKDCEDNSSGKRFGFIESWDNCFGQLKVIDYFESVSKFTDQEKPHDIEVDLIYTGEFRNGLPHGKGYAKLTYNQYNRYSENRCYNTKKDCTSFEHIDRMERAFFQKIWQILNNSSSISGDIRSLIKEAIEDYNELQKAKDATYTDGKIPQNTFYEIDYVFYDGELKNGLPHGKGNLYFDGDLVEATWKNGCIDWSKPSSYKSGFEYFKTKLSNSNLIWTVNGIPDEEGPPYEEVNSKMCSYWVDKN